MGGEWRCDIPRIRDDRLYRPHVATLKTAFEQSPLGYATLAARAGVAVGTIHKLFSGKTKRPTLDTLFRLRRVLDVALPELDLIERGFRPYGLKPHHGDLVDEATSSYGGDTQLCALVERLRAMSASERRAVYKFLGLRMTVAEEGD